MNKTIVSIVAFALILGGVYWLSTIHSSERPVSEDTINGAVDENAPVNGIEVRGTVIDMDLDQAMVDGPYVLVVREDNGDEAVIVVPSMGIMTCAAYKNIANVSSIEIGMMVEAKGSLTAQGGIIPCESASHYLRVVSR